MAGRRALRRSLLVTLHRHAPSVVLPLLLLLLLPPLWLAGPLAAANTHITGEAQPCQQDTDAHQMTSSLRQYSPCYTCSCQNGVVVCLSRRCPVMEGCHRLLRPDPDDKCSCPTCQGCMRGGQEAGGNTSLVHGEVVRVAESCQVDVCEAGVITSTQQQCYVPCAAPMDPPPGECCPACAGCRVEGRVLRLGESAVLSSDACVQCRCVGRRSLVCSKQACPVLSCLRPRRMPGRCCPVCHGSRHGFTLPPSGGCFLALSLQHNGSSRRLDPCTSCTCTDSHLHCTRHTCPPLTCPQTYQVSPVLGVCCPSCRLPQVSQVCTSEGRSYEHGSSWSLGTCATCTCNHGQVTCKVDDCPTPTHHCPPDHKLEQQEGECCPRCVSQIATCLAFGAPHYRTFDGLHYDFQGECKYTLTKDCGRLSKFRIKIINHSHKTAAAGTVFARSLVLKLHLQGYRMKVTMMVSRKTKVNGSRVRLPYRHRGDVLVITRLGRGVQLNTTMGLRLVWDGESYIEVALSPQWRNKTCGLCGNYNGDPADDLTRRSGDASRRWKASKEALQAGSSDLNLSKNNAGSPDSSSRGALKRDSSAKRALSHLESARTWARGRCSRRDRMRIKQRSGGREQRLTFCSNPSSRRLAACEPFLGPALQPCHALVPHQPFYKACVEDMCRCAGSRHCHCVALLAYARECQRLGAPLHAWRNATTCGGLECPHGAMYMKCAPACRATCRNPYPNQNCHTRRCEPGCYCPYSTVLHRGSCVPLQHCSSRRGKTGGSKQRSARRRFLSLYHSTNNNITRRLTALLFKHNHFSNARTTP